MDCPSPPVSCALGVAGHRCAGILARHTRAEASNGPGRNGSGQCWMCPFAGRGNCHHGDARCIVRGLIFPRIRRAPFMIKPVRRSHQAPVAGPTDIEGSARHGFASNRAGPIPRRRPSTVIEGVSAARIKAVCVGVNHAHVRGRRRQCGANQHRPGQAER